MTGFLPATAAEGRLTMRFYGDPAPPPARELIKGILPADGLAFLGGQSSAGKTFILILLAIVLAALEPRLFFGRRRKERVGVLIVAAEGHSTLEARLRAATKHLGIEGSLPIGIISFDGDLTTDVGNAELASLIRAASVRMKLEYDVRLGLIAIDTMGAAYVLSDEDSNAEANQIVRKARALATGVGALVMLVHHYGKTAGSGLRGASAYRANADAVLAVTADRNELQFLIKNRHLGLSKSRTGEEGPMGGFKLVQVELGVDEDGDRIASCAVLPSEGALTGDDAVAAKPGPTVLLDALHAALEAHGEAHPRAAPVFRAVKLEHVKTEFSDRYAARRNSDLLKTASIQRAFQRALDELAPRILRFEDTDGEWLCIRP